VPNGLIGVASNLTRVWARINLDLTVAHGTDLEAASGMVNEIGRQMAADPAWKRRVLEAPRVDRVSSLAGEGVTLKILGSVRAADRWAATGELRKRIATDFATEGIEIRGG
jgi:small conductance mechanosensitive channel